MHLWWIINRAEQNDIVNKKLGLLTIKQISKELNISEQILFYYAKTGIFKTVLVQVGGTKRAKLEWVLDGIKQEYIKRQIKISRKSKERKDRAIKRESDAKFGIDSDSDEAITNIYNHLFKKSN